jgi:hypothetical protein
MDSIKDSLKKNQVQKPNLDQFIIIGRLGTIETWKDYIGATRFN